ncbi:MAG: sigma-54 interaction domain-containing protein, partial [Tumebacillaceae bacterium]
MEMLKAILASIDEGIHAVDRNGITIYYNEAAARLDGVDPQEVIGRHVLEVFPSLDPGTSTLLQVIESGVRIPDHPQMYTNYLGTKAHTMNTTLPILSGGKLVGALEVAKDLTRVKELQEKLIDLQAQIVGVGRSSGSKKKSPMEARWTFEQILTSDRAVAQLKELAARAATTSSPVLIHGETGTGKELFVQSIHNASPRMPRPFIAQNCAALPASLLEGLLFGTVKGSFTGAENRPGLFELADGGTLFLDEINSMPLELQAKLLRVLQEGLVRRVGDTKVIEVDVRILAATNQNPLAAIETGNLRSDLYYRLNVVSLPLPPLRERKGDIPLLTRHFVEKFNRA